MAMMNELPENPHECGCGRDQRLRTLVDNLEDVKNHAFSRGQHSLLDANYLSPEQVGQLHDACQLAIAEAVRQERERIYERLQHVVFWQELEGEK